MHRLFCRCTAITAAVSNGRCDPRQTLWNPARFARTHCVMQFPVPSPNNYREKIKMLPLLFSRSLSRAWRTVCGLPCWRCGPGDSISDAPAYPS